MQPEPLETRIEGRECALSAPKVQVEHGQESLLPRAELAARRRRGRAEYVCVERHTFGVVDVLHAPDRTCQACFVRSRWPSETCESAQISPARVGSVDLVQVMASACKELSQ